MEESSFEQAINEHLELNKPAASSAQLRHLSTRGRRLKAAVRRRRSRRTPNVGRGDFWAAARDFDWGD